MRRRPILNSSSGGHLILLWLPYVVVHDIEASTKKAKSLGATVMKEVTEVPNMGWLSIILDPTGAMLGLWKTKL